jgi:hypothetical protein
VPTVTETVEVKSEAKNTVTDAAPPPPADPPFLTEALSAVMPLPPPPPAPHNSTKTVVTPAGLVHVPDEVKD